MLAPILRRNALTAARAFQRRAIQCVFSLTSGPLREIRVAPGPASLCSSNLTYAFVPSCSIENTAETVS